MMMVNPLTLARIRAGLSGSTYNSTGSKTLTAAQLANQTPTGALLFGNRADNFSGSTQADASVGMGVYGTSNSSVFQGISLSSDDGLTTSDNGNRLSSATMRLPSANASSDDGTATSLSLGVSDFDFSYTAASGTANLASMLLGGYGIRCVANTVQPNASIGGTSFKTVGGAASGNRPIALIALNTVSNINDWSDSSNIHSGFSMGFCDDSFNQGSIAQFVNDNQATTRVTAYVSDAYFKSSCFYGSLTMCAEVTSIFDGGITITTRESTSNRGSLAFLSIGGIGRHMRSKVLIHQPSGASGSVTGAGFKPVAIFKLTSTMTTLNTVATDTAATERMSFGMAADNNGSVQEFCWATREEAGVGTSDSDCRAYNDRISQTASYQMGITSFDSDGYSWDDGGGTNLPGTEYHIDLLIG